jgi:hypothetical protein
MILNPSVAVVVGLENGPGEFARSVLAQKWTN